VTPAAPSWFASRPASVRTGTVLGVDGAFDGMVGDSPEMRRMFERIARIAGLDAPVLIQGDTGTGKELVARSIHGRSRRCRGPFVAVNRAAVLATLVESEFFGHARGAFTDAREARRGRFEEAHGGTLFLEEIGEMPADVQPKFLRALQKGEIAPLGAARPIPVDVRLVCATNRDLRAAAVSGGFRLDLFFRIAALMVSVPPLRDRIGDVPALARYLLHQVASSAGVACAGIAHEALAVLAAYDWPGNVRELQALGIDVKTLYTKRRRYGPISGGRTGSGNPSQSGASARFDGADYAVQMPRSLSIWHR
jgi:two-component system, NtrC family, response regulator HydG